MLDKRVSRFRKAIQDWTGEDHYKSAEVEPIDLIQASGLLTPYSSGNIIKYASRLNSKMKGGDVKGVKKDLLKIFHYAGFIWEDITGDKESLLVENGDYQPYSGPWATMDDGMVEDATDYPGSKIIPMGDDK